MKFYSCTDTPIRLCGLCVNGADGNFWRMPADVVDTINDGVKGLGRRSTGGRVRFRTNSKAVSVKVTLKTLSVDPCIPLPGSAGADVFLGTGLTARYVCVIAPRNYNDLTNEKTFNKAGDFEQVTINLPRNEQVAAVVIGLDDGAELTAPLPYAFEKPIVYYGSSITEGGCATRPGNAYTALLSRWLDADYYNWGFSGNARGETAMARFIAGREMALFVYDYDHNAPSVEHLSETHRPFFNIIRQAQPELPILMVSKPDFDSCPEDNAKRRAIIAGTYESAVAAGDRNVWFVDGETLFGKFDRSNCTIDGCHPNDLGFMRMAETLYPLARRILLWRGTTSRAPAAAPACRRRS